MPHFYVKACCDTLLHSKGGEHVYYHEPHELCIIAGGAQNPLILSSYNSTFT